MKLEDKIKVMQALGDLGYEITSFNDNNPMGMNNQSISITLMPKVPTAPAAPGA